MKTRSLVFPEAYLFVAFPVFRANIPSRALKWAHERQDKKSNRERTGATAQRDATSGRDPGVCFIRRRGADALHRAGRHAGRRRARGRALNGAVDVLSGIYEFCAARGWPAEGEAIRVGAWPTQFVPAFSPLTQEAMEQAETADFERVPFRVVRADHLAVIVLSVGRAKDFTRILALLESGSVGREEIRRLAAQHRLAEPWRRFENRLLNDQ